MVQCVKSSENFSSSVSTEISETTLISQLGSPNRFLANLEVSLTLQQIYRIFFECTGSDQQTVQCTKTFIHDDSMSTEPTLLASKLLVENSQSMVIREESAKPQGSEPGSRPVLPPLEFPYVAYPPTCRFDSSMSSLPTLALSTPLIEKSSSAVQQKKF